MNDPVDIDDAKTKLEALLELVERGDVVVIARAGEPIARLCPMPAPLCRRRLGEYEGQIVIADDFDQLPDDVASSFGSDR